MAKFILKIDLGNEAMISGNDIAKALHLVALSINSNDPPVVRNGGNIRDTNGNHVGSFMVVL